MAPLMKSFSHEMSSVHDQLKDIADLVGEQFEVTHKTITESTFEKVDEVKEMDKEIDEKYEKLQSEIINLFITHTPLPEEVKALTILMRLSRELERVGDHMVNIMEAVDHVKQDTPPPDIGTVHNMMTAAEKMHRMTLGLFENYDKENADEIVRTDEKVDRYFHQFRTELPELIQREPAYVEDYMQFFLISRFIERAADHTVNVVRRMRYII